MRLTCTVVGELLHLQHTSLAEMLFRPQVGSYSIKTIRHVRVFDTSSAQAWAELVFTLMVALYLIDELVDMLKFVYMRAKLRRLKLDTTPEVEKSDYFADAWNIVDVCNYLLFLFSIVYEIRARYQLQNAAEELNTIYSVLPEAVTSAVCTPLADQAACEAADCTFIQDGGACEVPFDPCTSFASQAACEAAGCTFMADCEAPRVLPASMFFASHVSMYGSVSRSAFAHVLLGVNSIITWLKLLKYLNTFPHMAMMTKTVTVAMYPSLSVPGLAARPSTPRVQI